MNRRLYQYNHSILSDGCSSQMNYGYCIQSWPVSYLSNTNSKSSPHKNEFNAQKSQKLSNKANSLMRNKNSNRGGGRR